MEVIEATWKFNALAWLWMIVVLLDAEGSLVPPLSSVVVAAEREATADRSDFATKWPTSSLLRAKLRAAEAAGLGCGKLIRDENQASVSGLAVCRLGIADDATFQMLGRVPTILMMSSVERGAGVPAETSCVAPPFDAEDPVPERAADDANPEKSLEAIAASS